MCGEHSVDDFRFRVLSKDRYDGGYKAEKEREAGWLGCWRRRKTKREATKVEADFEVTDVKKNVAGFGIL